MVSLYMNLQEASALIESIRGNLAKVIVGKEDGVNLLLTALLANGHVLLEDVPGTGKTLLAKTLARSLDCTFKRIQFTPDLLPSDLSGINYYNQKSGNFNSVQVRYSPVFCSLMRLTGPLRVPSQACWNVWRSGRLPSTV